MLDKPSKSELVAKTPEKNHSTQVGEMRIDERETWCSQAIGHIVIFPRFTDRAMLTDTTITAKTE